MTCFEVARGCEITLFDCGDSVTQTGLRSDLNVSAKYSTALCWLQGPQDKTLPWTTSWRVEYTDPFIFSLGALEKRPLRKQNAIVLSLRNYYFHGIFVITLGVQTPSPHALPPHTQVSGLWERGSTLGQPALAPSSLFHTINGLASTMSCLVISDSHAIKAVPSY